MKTQDALASRALAVIATTTLALSLGACGNMSRQNKNTAVGAGAGAVGGAVLTGGSTLGTLGGAAIGGLIGNQIEPKK
jgi:osmotically inducible lipoprotein OsmB